jgi:hypothetical protein
MWQSCNPLQGNKLFTLHLFFMSMKLLLPAWLLVGLLTATSSCKKADQDQPELVKAICPDMAVCPGAGDVVKTVAEVRGIVRLNPVTHEYAITTYPTVTNAFSVGVLCAALPTELRVEDGTKVVFSGTYRLKPGAPTGGDVSIFYLSPSKVSLDSAL